MRRRIVLSAHATTKSIRHCILRWCRGKAHAHYERDSQNDRDDGAIAEGQHRSDSAARRHRYEPRQHELGDSNDDTGDPIAKAPTLDEPDEHGGPHERDRNVNQHSNDHDGGNAAAEAGTVQKRVTNRREGPSSVAQTMANCHERAGRRRRGDATDDDTGRDGLPWHAPKQAMATDGLKT